VNTKRVPVAIIGAGRMGHAIASLAPERSCEIVAMLDVDDTRAGLTTQSFNNAAVAIEFTEPAAAVNNAIACMRAGMPVVIGTTGWSAQMPALVDAAREFKGHVLWSPNFSLGVQLFMSIAEHAARVMKSSGAFDTHVVETHHAAKKDAPSGTAIAIADALKSGSGDAVIQTSSVRTGHVPGTHEVIFDAPFEQVRLVHEARDRRVFADGALHAARWLATVKAPGIYTMRDMIAAQTSAEHT
jgi:4-hydroxy-tetrahydrodipicolinate reductase